MKVLLISVNKEVSFRPALPIGMATVAGQARAAGHAVSCLDLCFVGDDESAVRAESAACRPDVVGVSIRNVDSQNFLEPVYYPPFVLQVVDWVRAAVPAAPVVLGGAGFSHLPLELMQYTRADYGIAGFGEVSFPLLLERLAAGRGVDDIGGIVRPLPGGGFHQRPPDFEVDLAGLLPPAREVYDPRYFEYDVADDDAYHVPVETVQTKKGCPLRCSYCSNYQVDGRGLALKPVERVLDEIERIAGGGGKGFEIVDGVFNVPLGHALEVCRGMARRGLNLPYACMLNPGTTTAELVDLLQATGCRYVEFGTDSGCDRVLERLGKGFRREQVRAAHDLVRARGLQVLHCVFLGAPGDDGDSVRESLALLAELVPPGRPSPVRAYLSLGLRVFGGTRLHQDALRDGLLRPGQTLAVPRFYVAPAVLGDASLLDEIEARVVANGNWYLWWGLPNWSLRERVAQVQRDNARLEELYRAALRRGAEREPVQVASWTH
jgi:radical SAM superfamily enzyme YgiQ (UPF0313 family)